MINPIKFVKGCNLRRKEKLEGILSEILNQLILLISEY